MRGQRGSFLGFTFNDIHSSVFGITRTSDGTRSNQNLAPMRTDETMEVPGADGAIYIGSTFEKAEFTINYAFDSVTED
jgi:phage-related protein